MPKDRYHHGDLRNSLINVSRELIAEQGAEELSLRIVAERAGVSRTAMYRHFSNKLELIGAVVISGFNELQAVTSAELDSDLPAIRQLGNVGRAYATFASSNPALYSVMFHPRVHDHGCEHVAAAAASSFAVLLRALTLCRDAGAIKQGDIRQQAFTLWSSVHGTVTLCGERAPSVLPEVTLERGLEMVMLTLLDGLAVNPAETA